jgi:ElaB/YqjD/DUF883 family membrane-anchored ribosome-binding protein
MMNMQTENTTQFGSTSSSAGGMNTGGSNSDMSAGAGQSDGVRDMARNLATEAKNKAGEQVRSSLDKGRSRAADTLHEVARTLMGTGDQADNPAAPYMNRAGEQVRRAADYLQNADLNQMVTSTEQFARRQPALFLGTAFAIGVLAARFLKSSRPDSDQYGSGFGSDQMYDRERSLSNYREPTGYSAGTAGYSAGTAGYSSGNAGLAGGDAIDDDLDWPGSAGASGSSSGIGPTGR